MKNSGKSFSRGKFSSSKGDRKEFKKKDGKDSQTPQGIVCYECNGHGHLKKECPNYLRVKGKAYATTLSDSDLSNSDSEESCDGEGNYSAFMTIAHVKSSEDLKESDAEKDEDSTGLQENYNSQLEKSGEYTRVAKAAVKQMKKAEKDYKSLLVRYKEAKCEIETLNGELIKAYSKIRFLELKVVQGNAKIERVSMKKLDDVVSSQKHFSDKSGLGYTGGSSSSANVTKDVRFVKAREPVVVVPTPEKIKDEKKKNVADQRVLNKPCNQTVVKPKVQGKSPPNLQRGPRIQHFCHFYGLQGHTRPNCHKLKALKNASVQRSKSPKNRNWVVISDRCLHHLPGELH
ncbi:uncharacterized protein LOC136069652 [Quercus suber]|uniref:uncharacterized protein LOC136069652 n=1 Tax=Quercus suber TaxID=58331 RepID=UPI0032DFACC3